jgi:serine/threonine-protein kinase
VDEDFMIGTNVGSFVGRGFVIDGRLRLEERLGEGAVGEVWRAMDLELGSHVAVKRLAPRLQRCESRENHVASFFREAALARRVDCPHSVRVMECASSPDLGPYIVMEMLDGLDLFEHLARSGTLEIAETAAIVAQLCLALDALHAADVFHRDVKPENVVMTTRLGRPCATLIDFSIAREGSSASEELEEGIFGTPAYLSPERLSGSSPGRAQADLWALAVLAYQCLVGKVPFDDKSVATICVAVNRGTFTPPGFDEHSPARPPTVSPRRPRCARPSSTHGPRFRSSLRRASERQRRGPPGGRAAYVAAWRTAEHRGAKWRDVAVSCATFANCTRSA